MGVPSGAVGFVNGSLRTIFPVPPSCTVVGRGTRDDLALSMNAFLRGLGTAALFGMVLIIANQTAGCIGRERTKRTLDDLQSKRRLPVLG